MKRFDLIVIGGGSAGLVAAGGAARLGAKVALVDRISLGGDCLRTGCVPTKRLLQTAKVASLIKRAGEFGLKCGDLEVDFPGVMASMRRVQSAIGEHDSPERFRKMGVEVFIGEGRFIDSHLFEVSKEVLFGRRFIIATGSSPVVLPIPGLKESGALTNETAIELEELPKSIAILGAGPIGMEFAQVFARLGSKVTVIEKLGQILPHEEAELSDMLFKSLTAEGIRIDVNTRVTEVRRENGRIRVFATSPGGERVYDVDKLMIAIGRSPNTGGLNLDTAGVEFDLKRGIKVDERLRTTAKHIYACGDVIGQYAFTHVAEYHARIAVGNALFPVLKRKIDYRVVPWTTFVDPELARVGMTEDEAREAHGQKGVHVYRYFFNDIDRAVIEGEGTGIVKVVTDRHKRILGAHILGPHAGELIHEYVLAMQAGIPITKISRAIHVYPTDSIAVKKTADEYYREKLFTGWFPRFAKIFTHHGV